MLLFLFLKRVPLYLVIQKATASRAWSLAAALLCHDLEARENLNQNRNRTY